MTFSVDSCRRYLDVISSRHHKGRFFPLPEYDHGYRSSSDTTTSDTILFTLKTLKADKESLESMDPIDLTDAHQTNQILCG